MTAISVTDLRKAYGDVEAVRGISFAVAAGEVFCLLGPNGAGKTTTTEILEGYRARSAGEVRVLGHDPEHGERALRERVGIVLQEAAAQAELTVAEVLDHVRALLPAPRGRSASSSSSSASPARRARASKLLSGGQQRRLDLALALVGDPDLLFLDEPTTGFDPSRPPPGVVDDQGPLRAGQDGLPHHPLHGRGAGAGRPRRRDGRRAHRRPRHARARSAGATPRRPRSASRCPTTSRLPDLPALDGGERRPARARAHAARGCADPRTLTGWALERGLELRGFAVSQPSLEDIYLD